eukprot:scaffold12617_cov172-Amphora_coffeaeformis.AAC.1
MSHQASGGRGEQRDKSVSHGERLRRLRHPFLNSSRRGQKTARCNARDDDDERGERLKCQGDGLWTLKGAKISATRQPCRGQAGRGVGYQYVGYPRRHTGRIFADHGIEPRV